MENKKPFNWINVSTLITLLMSIGTFALVVAMLTIYQVDQAREAGAAHHQKYQEFIFENRDETVALSCDDYDRHTVFTWEAPVEADAYEIAYHTKVGGTVKKEDVFETSANTYTHVYDSKKDDLVFTVKAIKADGSKSVIGAEAIIEDNETQRCGV